MEGSGFATAKTRRQLGEAVLVDALLLDGPLPPGLFRNRAAFVDVDERRLGLAGHVSWSASGAVMGQLCMKEKR